MIEEQKQGQIQSMMNNNNTIKNSKIYCLKQKHESNEIQYICISQDCKVCSEQKSRLLCQYCHTLNKHGQSSLICLSQIQKYDDFKNLINKEIINSVLPKELHLDTDYYNKCLDDKNICLDKIASFFDKLQKQIVDYIQNLQKKFLTAFQSQFELNKNIFDIQSLQDIIDKYTINFHSEINRELFRNNNININYNNLNNFDILNNNHNNNLDEINNNQSLIDNNEIIVLQNNNEQQYTELSKELQEFFSDLSKKSRNVNEYVQNMKIQQNRLNYLEQEQLDNIKYDLEYNISQQLNLIHIQDELDNYLRNNQPILSNNLEKENDNCFMFKDFDGEAIKYIFLNYIIDERYYNQSFDIQIDSLNKSDNWFSVGFLNSVTIKDIQDISKKFNSDKDGLYLFTRNLKISSNLADKNFKEIKGTTVHIQLTVSKDEVKIIFLPSFDNLNENNSKLNVQIIKRNPSFKEELCPLFALSQNTKITIGKSHQQFSMQMN